MMKIKYLVFYLFVSAGLISSCNTTEAPADMGYAYFPIDTGRYYIYDVDSVRIDCAFGINDTNHYQIKETYPSTFVDAMDEQAVMIIRYYRTDTTQPWLPLSDTSITPDVWWVKRTNTRLEKSEENLRIVKMTYPINESYTWNGNAYNVLAPQTFEYGPQDVSFNNGFANFDNTISVIQQHDTTMIDYYYYSETYARDIGMIYKTEYSIPNLLLNETDCAPWPYPGLTWNQVPKLWRVKQGSIVISKLIEYGFE